MSLDLREQPPEELPRGDAQPRVTAATVARRRLVGTALVVGPLLWAVWRSFGSGRSLVNTGGIPIFGHLLAAIAHPVLTDSFLRVVADATLVTLVYAALGAAGALVIGLLGAVVLSDVAWRHRPGPIVRLVRLALRALLVALRSIHEVIWALLFVSVLGLDPLVAVLAIAVPFGAQTAKVFSEILDEVSRDAVTAMRASGARSVPALAYGLLPAAAPLLLAYAFYRFECAIRSAVVLGVVGIGGLGAQIVVSLESRDWDQVWTLIAAVVALSAVVDVWSSRLRGDMAVASCSDWSGGRVETTGGHRSLWARWSAVVAFAGVGVAWFASGVSWAGLVSPRTRQLTTGLVAEMLPPQLPLGGWPALGGAVLDTIAMALVAMVLAVAISLVVGPLATRVRPVPFSDPPGSYGRALRGLARVLSRALLLVLRSVPPTVWAAVALIVLFPGVLPGAVALGLYAGGILGRLLAEAWETINLRPRDALRAAGVRPVTAAISAVLPPSWRHLISYTLYRFEICVRDTAIVGVVGAAGLGRLFAENLTVFDFPVVTTLLLASFAVSVASEVLGRWVRRTISG